MASILSGPQCVNKKLGYQSTSGLYKCANGAFNHDRHCAYSVIALGLSEHIPWVHDAERNLTITGKHYDDVRMGAIASQFTSLTIVYSIVYSDADQRKHQSSASLAFVRGNHRRPVNSPHKWPVTRKCFLLMTSSYHTIAPPLVCTLNALSAITLVKWANFLVLLTAMLKPSWRHQGTKDVLTILPILLYTQLPPCVTALYL